MAAATFISAAITGVNLTQHRRQCAIARPARVAGNPHRLSATGIPATRLTSRRLSIIMAAGK